MPHKIAVLPGDGIGPEVTAEAVKVLKAVTGDLEFEETLVGGAAYDATGHPLPDETLKLCRKADAVLLGAVGGPKWDAVEPKELRPEVGALLTLRKKLDLYANLRPARIFKPLMDASPIRFGPSGPIDLIIVRELTGGIYFGDHYRQRSGEEAVDTCRYTREQIRRVAECAFEIARLRKKTVVCVDKANVLETSRLWREVLNEVKDDYKDVELSFMLVDNCAMQLVRDPGQFDVILTENMFGDILSDEAGQITGSLGLLPSASLSGAISDRRLTLGDADESPVVFGLYEPVHGSAPDIAGQGKANPLGAILSAAMMLRYSFGMDAEADVIENAVESLLEQGVRTPDLGGTATTEDVGGSVASRV